LLHLSVLIESMRREGFELQVSQPTVITKVVDGAKQEPYEEVFLECDSDYGGGVIDRLNRRGGQMQDLLVTDRGTTRAKFIVPSRGLIGFRSEFLTESRGTGVMYAVFSHYGPWRGEVRRRTQGVLISQETCETVTYALHALQDRGYLCCGPGEDVYGGQIVGVNAKENDLVVNPAKEKKLTNMRASGTDDALRLTPARRFTLEEALEFIEDDELVEVTPKSIRLRKRFLDHSDRRRAEKSLKAS
jgi:GTP-binding protein